MYHYPQYGRGACLLRDLLGFVVAEQGTRDPKEAGPLLGLEDPDVPMAIVKCPDEGFASGDYVLYVKSAG
jgi:hypothetical protein